jgi:iron(III) transport system substrate-binding protein
MMGEDAGWKFMGALHRSVAACTHSGYKLRRQAAAGEYTVGLSFEYRASKTMKDGTRSRRSCRRRAGLGH